jgi:hypothetical protein
MVSTSNYARCVKLGYSRTVSAALHRQHARTLDRSTVIHGSGERQRTYREDAAPAWATDIARRLLATFD